MLLIINVPLCTVINLHDVSGWKNGPCVRI